MTDRCRFQRPRHRLALDYLTHTRPDGETFVYCTSHEPLTDRRRLTLEKWAGRGGTKVPEEGSSLD